MKNDYEKCYLNDVWTLFPLHGKKEKEYLSFFKKRIEEEITPETNYSELSEMFGNPQEIVSSFYAEVDFDYIINRMKIRNLIKKTIICLNIAFLVIVVWFMTLLYKSYESSQQDIIKYEEEIIEEK